MSEFTLSNGVSSNTAAVTVMSVAARADADTPTVESVLITNHANASVKIETITNSSLTCVLSYSTKTGDLPFVQGTDLIDLAGGESVLVTGTNATASAHTFQVAIGGVFTHHKSGASDGGKIYTGEIQ